MSSFIERFSIAGSAVVLGLMAVLGVFGYASLLVDGPQESLPPASAKVLVLEHPIYRAQPVAIRPAASAPEDPGEEPSETVAPEETPGVAYEAPAGVPAIVIAEVARSAGDPGALSSSSVATPLPAPTPAPGGTPAPLPNTAPPSTPAPRPEPPAEPTPTPEATPAPAPTEPPSTPEPTPTS
jgi:hypothetical protein